MKYLRCPLRDLTNSSPSMEELGLEQAGGSIVDSQRCSDAFQNEFAIHVQGADVVLEAGNDDLYSPTESCGEPPSVIDVKMITVDLPALDLCHEAPTFIPAQSDLLVKEWVDISQESQLALEAYTRGSTSEIGHDFNCFKVDLCMPGVRDLMTDMGIDQISSELVILKSCDDCQVNFQQMVDDYQKLLERAHSHKVNIALPLILIEGEDGEIYQIQNRYDDVGSLSLNDFESLFDQIEKFHQCGFSHGDIHYDNLKRDASGTLVLIDWETVRFDDTVAKEFIDGGMPSPKTATHNSLVLSTGVSDREETVQDFSNFKLNDWVGLATLFLDQHPDASIRLNEIKKAISDNKVDLTVLFQEFVEILESIAKVPRFIELRPLILELSIKIGADSPIPLGESLVQVPGA